MHGYDPKEIEEKWQDHWQKSGIYEAKDFSDLPKYYLLIEFHIPPEMVFMWDTLEVTRRWISSRANVGWKDSTFFILSVGTLSVCQQKIMLSRPAKTRER